MKTEMKRQHRCPACKVPLLIGEHTLQVDERRRADERAKWIMDAAIEVVKKWRKHDTPDADPQLSDAIETLRAAVYAKDYAP